MTPGAARRVVRSADPVEAGRELQAGSSAIVVVPSDAAARALGYRRASHTLARLARRHARSMGRMASAFTRRRALRSACARVFGEETATGYATRGAAAVSAWLRAGVPDEPPSGCSDRTSRWWLVASHYQRLLREQGAIDPVEAPRVVADRPPPAMLLTVVGYPTLDPDEVAMVDALAGPGSTVVLPLDPGWTEAADVAARDLIARGWRSETHAGEAPFAAVDAHRAATLEAEVRAALAEVKHLLTEGGHASEDVVIVTREPELYSRELRDVAASYGLPLRVERRVPLARTPLGGWLTNLVEVLADGLPFEASAALLHHPFSGLLDREAFDRARTWRPRGLAAWRRALRSSASSQRADEALDALAPLLSARWRPRVQVPRRAREWRDALDATLRLTLKPEVAAASSHAALVWARALDESLAPGVPLASVEGAEDAVGFTSPASPREPASVRRDTEALDHGAFLRTLRDALKLASVSEAQSDAAADARAVLVVAPEALAGARVRTLLVLGVAEGMLPARVVDPPLLDAFDREELRAAGVALETPADMARRERLAVWGLRRAAQRLWLSYPEQTGRDARLPSALLAELGAEPAPVELSRPASSAERRARDLSRAEAPDDDPVMRAARHAWRVELAREREPQRDGFDGVLGVAIDPHRRRWSATQLTTFGQCRFRWLAQSVWGVREPSEGEVEVTPLLRGSLYHHALAEALRPARGLRGEEARAVAEAALEPAFELAERRTAADSVPHWRHLRHEHLAHLRDLLRQSSFLPDDHEVLEVEREFRGSWHGLQVMGRVDRLDRGPSGVVVIDYKTGASRPQGARGLDGARLDLDLQLPLYLEVAASVLAPNERVESARYISLSAMREIPRSVPEPTETADFLSRLRSSLAAGYFPVEPSPACRYCALEAACRKGPRLDRKREPEPQREPPTGATQ